MPQGPDRSAFSIAFGSSTPTTVASDGPDGPTSGWCPFRLAYVAELQPRVEYALSPRSAAATYLIDAEGVDGLLARLAPSFQVDVLDPESQQGSLKVDLRWSRSNHLSIENLVRSSPALLSLSDALAAVRTSSNRPDQLHSALLRLLGPRAEHLRPLLPPANLPPPAGGKGPLGATDCLIDSLLSRVDLPTERELTAPTGYEPEALQHSLAAALNDLLRRVLAHPEYRRLERAWRGLSMLVAAARAGKNCQVHVIDLAEDAEQRLGALLESVAPDLILVEASLPASPRAVEQMSDWARRGADLSAPVVMTLGEEWFDAAPSASSAAAERPILCQARRTLLAAVAADEHARWLGVVTNDINVRDLTFRIDSTGAAVTEPSDPIAAWGFVGAGVGLGSLVLRRCFEQGQPYPFAGDSEGVLRGLTVRIVAEEQTERAICTRLWATEDDRDALARVGVSCLVPVKNRDSARLETAPSLYRTTNAAGDLGAPVSTLADQILAGRVLRMVSRELDARASRQGQWATETTSLQERLLALFPNPAPVGPEVTVTEASGHLKISVAPHRHGRLEMEGLQFSANLTRGSESD